MEDTTANMRLRGVNLGGWLVLEKWMKPSLFEGLAATDETTWCAELGAQAPARLRAHWDSFITRADFTTCGRNILPAPNKSPTTVMPSISGPSMIRRQRS